MGSKKNYSLPNYEFGEFDQLFLLVAIVRCVVIQHLVFVDACELCGKVYITLLYEHIQVWVSILGSLICYLSKGFTNKIDCGEKGQF